MELEEKEKAERKKRGKAAGGTPKVRPNHFFPLHWKERHDCAVMLYIAHAQTLSESYTITDVRLHSRLHFLFAAAQINCNDLKTAFTCAVWRNMALFIWLSRHLIFSLRAPKSTYANTYIRTHIRKEVHFHLVQFFFPHPTSNDLILHARRE